MNLGRQTPQFIASIHPAKWPCNVPRHATARCLCSLTNSILKIYCQHRPSDYAGMRSENSATGHIGFLEFINAAALPFARNPCNMIGTAILASIASSVERVHAATGIHPPSQPTRYPSTHDQLDQPGSGQNEPSQRAIESSRAGGSPASATVARHLNRVASAARAVRNSVNYERSTRT